MFTVFSSDVVSVDEGTMIAVVRDCKVGEAQ